MLLLLYTERMAIHAEQHNLVR